MRTINKLASIIVLSGLAFSSFANDDTNSPFACQAQTNKIENSNAAVQQYQCPPGEEAWVQLGDGQNAAFCMTRSGGGQKGALTSVCEVNPQYWREYSPVRHVCDPSKTPTDCAIEIY